MKTNFLGVNRNSQAIICCALIVVITGIVFWGHLAGRLTFPWDFQGPYFTHAVARMRDGTFVNPPQWLPWGGFGIPGYLSLQDGTWYLPQWLFDFLGLRYDLVGATRLQIAHVALGGIGVFVFLRSVGISTAASLMGAVSYIFMPSFFSNAQHVDIVRGTALFPWLLYCLVRLANSGNRWIFLIATLLFSQFFVGSYPGIIVAAAYACAMLVALELYNGTVVDGFATTLQRISPLVLAAVLGAMLASIKYMPALMDAENLRRDAGQIVAAPVAAWSTVVFDFDVPWLPNDVTMRDVFIPIALLLFAPAGVSRNRYAQLGILLTIFASLIMLSTGPTNWIGSHLPLMKLSRFHISDFRPMLYLGLSLLAGFGFDRWMASYKAPRSIALPIAIGLVVIVLFYMLGLSNGFELANNVTQLTILAVSLAAVVGWLFSRGTSAPLGFVCSVVIISGVVASGYIHQSHGARVWQSNRSDSEEISRFGDTIANLIDSGNVTSFPSRPQRDLYTEIPSERAVLFNDKYSKGWLDERFSAFGYEDLKGSATFNKIYGLAEPSATDSDRIKLRWLLAPTSYVLIESFEKFGEVDLARCTLEKGICSASSGSPNSIEMQEYFENGALYKVDLAAPSILAENEVWYPGWNGYRCTSADSGDCNAAVHARSVGDVVRAWSLPAGKYYFRTKFAAEGFSAARNISLAALFAMLLLTLTYNKAFRPHRVGGQRFSNESEGKE